MKVTQEKLPASQIGLEIEITPEMTQKAYEQVIQKFIRQANIPGFRKGKVPRQVIVQRFGTASLKAAALEDLIDDSLKEALKQEEIEALGNFQLISSFEELIGKYEPGSPLTFSASVDVQPEARLKQYKGLQVQAEEIKPDPARIDQVLEDYREQTATRVPVEGRPAQFKDIAVVDFKGILPSDDPEQEPEEFPGNQAEDFQVELDEGKFIEGFIDGIIGMNPGETKEVNAKFPEGYPAENLAGRTVIFTVTLKELKEKELPELDDDFAQEVSEFETLAELRESLEKRFTEEAEDKTKSNQEEALLNELLNQIEVELPETLIERETNFILNQTAMQLQNQGIDIRRFFNQETIPMLKERSRPDAIDRIKRTLALGEIAKQESIQVTPEEVNAKVDEILEQLDKQDIDRERLQSVVSEDLLKDKIVDWLIENSEIELLPEGTLTKVEESEDAEAEGAETATVETTAERVEDSDASSEVPSIAEGENPEQVNQATQPKAAKKPKSKPQTETTTSDALEGVSGEEVAPKPKKSKKAAKPEAESPES